jgi:hypothetical protein
VVGPQRRCEAGADEDEEENAKGECDAVAPQPPGRESPGPGGLRLKPSLYSPSFRHQLE